MNEIAGQSENVQNPSGLVGLVGNMRNFGHYSGNGRNLDVTSGACFNFRRLIKDDLSCVGDDCTLDTT